MATRKIKSSKRRAAPSRGAARSVHSSTRNQSPRRVSVVANRPKTAPKAIRPSFSKVLLESKAITASGLSRALARNGVIRQTKKGKVLPGSKFNASKTGLVKGKRAGTVLSIQTEITWKDSRGRKHRDITPSVLVPPKRTYEAMKSGLPETVLRSFLFALDRNNLRGDYTAYFRIRKGVKLKRSERPKAKDIRVKFILTGHKTGSKKVNR